MGESSETLARALRYGAAGALTGTALGYYANRSLVAAMTLGAAMGLAVALAILTVDRLGVGKG